MLKKWKKFSGLSPINVLVIALGSAMIAFAMINIHEPSKITEGGILGLGLLLKNLFGIPQAVSSPILDILTYGFALTVIGKQFLKTSLVSSVFYAFFLWIFNGVGPVIRNLYNMPFLAALIGGLFIGIGASLVIMQGGASGGDDALAMAVSHKSGIKLSWVFFGMDFVILTLSLTYIPFGRLIWSFLTTCVSSVVIGQFEPIFQHKKKVRAKERRQAQAAARLQHELGNS